MIIDPDEITNMLFDYSRDHFSKAQGMPFTVDPLQCLLHYNGIMPFGNQGLRGHADLDQLPMDHATKALLQHLCNKSTNPNQCSHLLNYKELQNGIKNGWSRQLPPPPGDILAYINLFSTASKRRTTLPWMMTHLKKKWCKDAMCFTSSSTSCPWC